jgi:hypothetical protein
MKSGKTRRPGGEIGVLLHLLDEAYGKAAWIEGSNFFDPPAPTEKSWRAEREILDRQHRALRAAVAAFPPDRLRSPLPGTRGRTALREIAGIALHDVYHTGQIQLIKALRKKTRAR